MARTRKIMVSRWMVHYGFLKDGWTEEKFPRSRSFSSEEKADEWIERMANIRPDFILGDVEEYKMPKYIEEFDYEPKFKVDTTQGNGHMITIETPEEGVGGKFEIVTESRHEFIPVFVFSPRSETPLDDEQKQQAWRRLMENANIEVKYKFIF